MLLWYHHRDVLSTVLTHKQSSKCTHDTKLDYIVPPQNLKSFLLLVNRFYINSLINTFVLLGTIYIPHISIKSLKSFSETISQTQHPSPNLKIVMLSTCTLTCKCNTCDSIGFLKRLSVSSSTISNTKDQESVPVVFTPFLPSSVFAVHMQFLW